MSGRVNVRCATADEWDQLRDGMAAFKAAVEALKLSVATGTQEGQTTLLRVQVRLKSGRIVSSRFVEDREYRDGDGKDLTDVDAGPL